MKVIRCFPCLFLLSQITHTSIDDNDKIRYDKSVSRYTVFDPTYECIERILASKKDTALHTY